MKTFRFAIYLVLVFLISSQALFAQKTSEDFVKDELLIKFKSGTNNESALKANREVGSQMVEKLGDLGWQRIKLRNGLSIEDAISQYKKFAEVDSVQPNYYYKLAVTPNDANYGSLYGMDKNFCTDGLGYRNWQFRYDCCSN